MLSHVGSFRLVLMVVAASLVVQAGPKDCAALGGMSLPNAKLKSELVGATGFTPPGEKPISDLPSFCRVTLMLTPSSDSAINAEVWLPVDGWNGRLQGVGNGGFAGSIGYSSLAEALRAHYATVGTDTGHQGGAEDASWALNHPQKIIDFGYRAVHLMTEDAKQIVKAFYGEAAAHSFFSSCSNGGREALMEAQRFPNDYDGIIAGAPANYWTHLISNGALNALAFTVPEGSAFPASKLPAIQAAAQRACDLNDKVKDNIIEDPSRCDFDTSVLLCKGADSDSCLTANQVAALNKLYAGGHLSDGKVFFPGYSPGGEAAKGNWEVWITGATPGGGSIFKYGSQFFKNMIYNNPDWDFHSFEADRDVRAADKKMAATLNSMDPDLRPFIARGGKLILYHGWDDAAIAPMNTIHYFESVSKKIGASTTGQSVRLFMVPGMDHCFQGNGAYNFGQFGAGSRDASHDVDTALVQWVEKGVAPEQIVAAKPGASMTHLLCSYPKTAHYKGSGDIASAESYSCELEGAR